jgi:hypothetical protein
MHRAKVEQMSVFMKRNAEIDEHFNTLLVSLELFTKYTDPKSVSESQKALRTKSQQLYLDFDKSVWWWVWNWYSEARTLELLSPSDDPAVKEHLMAYIHSWEPVLASLEHAWKGCLNDNFQVGDTTVMGNARAMFNKSVEEREDITQFLLSRFNLE